MEHSQLEGELVAEGKSFTSKYTSYTGDKDFISSITKAFNRNMVVGGVLGGIVGALSESDTAKHFAIMHGYLRSAYIFGMAEDDEPEWAESRETSWRRWVQYLRVVEAYPRNKAIAFAKRFFYAVDSVAAYT